MGLTPDLRGAKLKVPYVPRTRIKVYNDLYIGKN